MRPKMKPPTTSTSSDAKRSPAPTPAPACVPSTTRARTPEPRANPPAPKRHTTGAVVAITRPPTGETSRLQQRTSRTRVCVGCDSSLDAYGRYVGPPSRAELEKLFFLDDADSKLASGSCSTGTYPLAGVIRASPGEIIVGDPAKISPIMHGGPGADTVNRVTDAPAVEADRIPPGHSGKESAVAAGPSPHRGSTEATVIIGRIRCARVAVRRGRPTGHCSRSCATRLGVRRAVR
jgi:hypothetical protein